MSSRANSQRRKASVAVVLLWFATQVAAYAGDADGTAPRTAQPRKTDDVATEEPLWQAPIYAGGDPLTPACLCSASQTVALCTGRNCELRKIRSGALIRTIGPHDFDVSGVILSPDGKLLASFQDTSTAYRQVQGKCTTYSEPTRPEGDIHVVYLWETANGKLRFRLRGHLGEVGDLVFSSDGTRLLAFAYGNKACLWNTETGDLLAMLDGSKISSLSPEFLGATWAKFGGTLPNNVLVTGANELVAYGNAGYRIRGVPLASIGGEFSGGLGRERSCEIAVSSDRIVALTRVVAPDNPQFWNEWQAKNRPLSELSAPADGRQAWYAKQPLSLAAYSPADADWRGTILDRAHSYRDIAFTPDGRRLASVRLTMTPKLRYVHELVLWDVQLRKPALGPPAAASQLPASSGTDAKYVFSPDSRWLLYGAYKARFLNLETFRWFQPRHEVEIVASEGHEGVGGRFEISSDGEYLLGVGFGGELRVWRFPPILQDLVEIIGPLPSETE